MISMSSIPTGAETMEPDDDDDDADGMLICPVLFLPSCESQTVCIVNFVLFYLWITKVNKRSKTNGDTYRRHTAAN